MTDRIKALEDALRKLELANDRVCGERPQRVYNLMIAGGMSDALLELDCARAEARAALAASQPAPDCHQPGLVIAQTVQPLTVQDAARVPADFQSLVNEAMAEATRAMAKFPQPNYVISKFAEESGEVVKAAIHYAEGREARDAVVSEMRQTIAMMLRLWIEGDQVHGLRAIAEGK